MTNEHSGGSEGAGDAVLEGKGFKIPLPRWGPGAITVTLILIAVVAATIYGGLYLLDHLRHDDQNAVRVKAAELVQLNEAAKHFGEPPEKSVEIYHDARGLLDVQLYPSDGCLLVARHSPDPRRPVINQFILDPSRIPDTPAPKFVVDADWSLEPAAFAQTDPNRCATIFAAQPHPGQFRWWYGQRSPDGCWTQVWRQFEDSCTHWQAFNGCNNSWDPVIHWTLCYH